MLPNQSNEDTYINAKENKIQHQNHYINIYRLRIDY